MSDLNTRHVSKLVATEAVRVLDFRSANGLCIFCGTDSSKAELLTAKSSGKKVCRTCFEVQSKVVPRTVKRKAKRKSAKLKVKAKDFKLE